MKIRIALFSVILLATLTFIGWMFWEQELKYTLPTPVPANFIDVKLGEKVGIGHLIQIPENKPVLLHFFSFNCSCALFNMQDFKHLAQKHKDDVFIVVILQSEDQRDIDTFKNKYGLDLPVVLDQDGTLSDICGIYATPQAVILDKNRNLYFKGNYNKTRYCTQNETKFVDLALASLLKNEPLPDYFEDILTAPYGCTLPSDIAFLPKKSTGILNMF